MSSCDLPSSRALPRRASALLDRHVRPLGRALGADLPQAAPRDQVHQAAHPLGAALDVLRAERIARLGGEVIGVMPLYVKTHSQGEYVFDHAWAHAFERAGGDYYPKLQSAAPFTPATGRRFLTAPHSPTITPPAPVLLHPSTGTPSAPSWGLVRLISRDFLMWA